jgi:hypothetical protein
MRLTPNNDCHPCACDGEEVQLWTVGPRPVDDIHKRWPTTEVIVSSGRSWVLDSSGSDDAANTNNGWAWVAGPEAPTRPTRVTWREVIEVAQITATVAIQSLVLLSGNDAVVLDIWTLTPRELAGISKILEEWLAIPGGVVGTCACPTETVTNTSP